MVCMPTGPSRDVHLLQVVRVDDIPGAEILDLPIGQARLARVLLEAAAGVDAAAGEHEEVVLDVGLAVVGVGDAAGELVELGGANGADAAGEAGGVGGSAAAAGVRGAVARRGLERREARLQGDVEQGEGGQAEEGVVRLDEERRELGPPRGGPHVPVLWVVRLRGKGEEHAGLPVLVREGLLEGIEVLAREGDGVEEPVLVLRADQLDILLEPELELEVALWWRCGARGAEVSLQITAEYMHARRRQELLH